MTTKISEVVYLTKDQQIAALKMLVPNWALGERRPGVAGGKEWVPHEYVIHALDTIFHPDNWSSEIGALSFQTTDDGEIMVYIPVRLTVTFADGKTVTRSDIGCGYIRQTKAAKDANAEDLSGTPIDNYSTGWKAAVTSGLKGCARDLGRVFIPMQSGAIASAISRGMFEAELRGLLPAPDPIKSLANGKRALGSDTGDLVEQPSSLESLAGQQADPPIEQNRTPAPPPPDARNVVKMPAKLLGNAFQLFEDKAGDFATRHPHYSKDGKPNKNHILSRLAALNFPQINAQNIDAAFQALEEYAIQNEAYDAAHAA